MVQRLRLAQYDAPLMYYIFLECDRKVETLAQVQVVNCCLFAYRWSQQSSLFSSASQTETSLGHITIVKLV